MDCVIVQPGADELVVTEPRRVRRGDKVAVGAAEDGSEGIFVHVEGFLGGTRSPNEFRFMAAEVSRERPVDYSVLAQLLGEEKERGGRILWVIGPALVHSRAREDMIWFIENGYVSTLFGGNAVAVHDLEAAIFGTTLGMSSSGESVEGGHGLHMRAINAIRRAGSIDKAVAQGIASSGIMHALVASHSRCARRIDSRRRAAARRHFRHTRRAGRDARAHVDRHVRRIRGDRAARDRRRQHAARIHRYRRDRGHPAAHDDLRRPDRVCGHEAA
jgi:hypothetical protein